MVMAIPRRAGLVPVNLDRQAVHVYGQISPPVTTPHAPEPPPRELGDRLTQHVAVRRHPQKRDQARQRRLRDQVRLDGQRLGAPRAACGQTQARVVPKRIDVVLVAPALAEKEKRRAQQIGQGIGDPRPCADRAVARRATR